MPGYDQTGPMGAGPMTGGGRGRCQGADIVYGRPFFRNRGRLTGTRYGRGFGCGLGRGGWNRSGFASYPMSLGEEISILKSEAEFLKNDLDRIHQQIATLEKSQSKE
jgi:hypothetical protein